MALVRYKLLGTLGLCVLAAGIFVWRTEQPASAQKPSPRPALIKEHLPTLVTKNLSSGQSTESQYLPNDQEPETNQQQFAQFQAMPIQTLWKRWTDLRLHKNQDSTLETAALIQKLQQNQHTAALYAEASLMLRDQSLTTEQRMALINVLAEASTPDALSVLSKLWLESKDETLRYALAEAIGNGPSGLSPWELAAHPELSPLPESLWQQPDLDAHSAQAFAARIAREGAPSGVQLLLNQIGQDGKTAAELMQNPDPRNAAAMAAMAEIRNPDLLSVLKQSFQSQPLESAAFFATGTALSQMGNVEATKILLEWARTAPDTAAAQSTQWLGTAASQDPDSSRFLLTELSQNDVFQSAQVKSGLLAVLKERE